MKCDVCGNQDAKHPHSSDPMVTRIDCPSCGRFRISQECIEDLPDFEDGPDKLIRSRLSRFLYETYDDGEKRLLTSEPNPGADGHVLDLESARHLYRTEGSPLDIYYGTLRNLISRTRRFGQLFRLPADRWLVPTMDDAQAESVIEALEADGYVDVSDRYDDEPFSLSPSGLRYAAELSRENKAAGVVVFVACCFKPELSAARSTIGNVLRELGYSPRLVNEIPHNDVIETQIYQGIEESKFVVADLTCNRQSVYYEVGFAHGLGLQVVLTCRKDCFDDTKDDWKRVHFDLNHRKILVWGNEADLSHLLRDHLRQVFGPADRPRS